MSKPFRFKQFLIRHDRCAMKVGTDGVLLGAVAHQASPKTILDIGTGTGLVALMLAQRFPEAQIEAVEIDDSAFSQAKENAEASPWADRIQIWHKSFQDFSSGCVRKFDLIVSNPPYFPNHLLSEDTKRNIALHQERLDFGDLVAGVSRVLGHQGVFWLILPPQQMEIFEAMAENVGLFPFFLLEISDAPQKKIHRHILGFSFKKNHLQRSYVSIKDMNGNYSKEYSELLRDFLIIF